MKNLILLVLIIIASMPQSEGATVVLTLAEVSNKVKTQDFTILENAQRIYQSKEAIQVARMNLLPRLNLWSVVGVIIDWKNAVGIIEDLVPFLVPGNWFRVRQQQLFFEADKMGFKSVQANEILTARALYLQAIMDEDLTTQIRASSERLKSIIDYTKLQEQFGEVAIGTSASIQAKYLSLLDDLRKMERLTYDERRGLALMMGISLTDEIALIKPAQVVISDLPRFELNQMVATVVKASPEVAQFDFLIEASRYVRREVYFNFLGISNLSRGVMGGVFDQYPIQPGLGFGAAASVRIVRSQTEQIGLQKDAATEVLKKQLAVIVEGFNANLDSYSNVSEALTQAKKYNDSLTGRIMLGDKVSALELVDGVKTLAEVETKMLSLNAEVSLNLDRISRLRFDGVYSDLRALPEEDGE